MATKKDLEREVERFNEKYCKSGPNSLLLVKLMVGTRLS